MNDEIQLLSDGDGLAVIGNAAAVERFLSSEGLAEQARNLDLGRLQPLFGRFGELIQTGSEVAENSGRWVKLTEESYQKVQRIGLMKSTETGNLMGVIHTGGQGGIKGIVQFAKGPTTYLTNPAALAGLGGIMAQAAMQQAMEEVTDYLAVIDEKVDDILQAQKDAALSKMIGVGFTIDEALTIRDRAGQVNEVTWSKVQDSGQIIAETQAYALSQLDAIAKKLEYKSTIGDIAKVAREAEAKTQEWLAVLARCFQLQDAISVLELDRVLDEDPTELDAHRLGLKDARQDRLKLITDCTERLLTRMNVAAGNANKKVLLHPSASPKVVNSSNSVIRTIDEFQLRLGIEHSREALEAKRWREAAEEVKDDAVEAVAEGVDQAKNVGAKAARQVHGFGSRIAEDVAKRVKKPLKDGATEDAADSSDVQKPPEDAQFAEITRPLVDSTEVQSASGTNQLSAHKVLPESQMNKKFQTSKPRTENPS